MTSPLLGPSMKKIKAWRCLEMLEKNHFCKYELSEDLVFCVICGENLVKGEAI